MRKLRGVIAAAVVIFILAAGCSYWLSLRRKAASDTFLLALELAQKGAWDDVSRFADPDYLTRFRGDFVDLTNELKNLEPGFSVNGGWNKVQIRYEYKAQPEWGVFFELRSVNGKWLINDRGRWTSSNL